VLRKGRALGEQLSRDYAESAQAASALGITFHFLAGLDPHEDWSTTRELSRQAILHQKRAQVLDPKNPALSGHLRNHRFALAQRALNHQDTAEASATAREMAAEGAGKANDLYDAACFLSRCVPLAKDAVDRDRFAEEA